MRIVGVLGSPVKGEPTRRKGVETGDIKKDGYRVVARAEDGYRNDVRRGRFMSHSSNLFEPCEGQYEDD